MSPGSVASEPAPLRDACKAVLGGTFDPVHCGHLHAARVGREALGVGSVVLLPAGQPWHRPEPLASAEHRWQMLGHAVRGARGLTRSNLEIVRQGPSYTVDTLAALAGDTPVVWFIGADALAAIASWHRAEELPALCNLLVFNRPGNAARPQPPRGFIGSTNVLDLKQHRSGRIHYLGTEMRDISASQVRHTIAAGGDPLAWLPQPIWAYIKTHGLYGATRIAREPNMGL